MVEICIIGRPKATKYPLHFPPSQELPETPKSLLSKESSVRKFALIVLSMCIVVMLFSACGKATDPAAKAVEDYLTALVNKDANALSAHSCADWESNALLELDSLQAVATRLENLACSATGTDSTTTQVNCQGKILATYNNEDQQLDLSLRTYLVVQQGGEYLVCGYK
jgi:hypothetical protein